MHTSVEPCPPCYEPSDDFPPLETQTSAFFPSSVPEPEEHKAEARMLSGRGTLPNSAISALPPRERSLLQSASTYSSSLCVRLLLGFEDAAFVSNRQLLASAAAALSVSAGAVVTITLSALVRPTPWDGSARRSSPFLHLGRGVLESFGCRGGKHAESTASRFGAKQKAVVDSTFNFGSKHTITHTHTSSQGNPLGICTLQPPRPLPYRFLSPVRDSGEF